MLPTLNQIPASYRALVKREKLASVAADSSAAVAPVFRIAVPDVRVRVRVRLIVAQATARFNATIEPSDTTLWAALCARGQHGQNAASLPIQNLVGTQAAPMWIPTDEGLYGHAFSVETEGGDHAGNGATEIQGVLSLNGNGAGQAAETWHIEVCWQALAPLTDAEWSSVQSRCYVGVS